jgi:hypothetical protein
VNPAQFRAQDQAFVERLQSYAEKPEAFRSRWRIRHFRFHLSSWLVAALLLAPLAWIAWTFGGLHLAIKGVLAVMALIAVLPLVRDFRSARCVLCDEEPERIVARKLSGEENVITACHHCRVFKVEEADSSPLPL